MGRKREPFTVKKYAPKTFPYERGRIFDYDYYHSDAFSDQYTIYMEMEEIKKLNKEKDIDKFGMEIRKEFFPVTSIDHYIPVNFTKDEFISFRRTKIIENFT